MSTSITRFGRAALIAGFFLSSGITARAQDRTPFPAPDQRVYVIGVPIAIRTGRSNQAAGAIVATELLRCGGQVDRPGPKRHTRYARELFDDWRSQASRSGRSFDAERSVIIVTGLENKQVAVHPGATLRNRFGLSAKTVEGELIQRIFIPLAEEGKYPEAISALLDATNQWIAARDSKTAGDPGNGRHSRPSSSAWFPTIVLGALVVLAIGLIGLVWAWVGHRRSRDRIGGRIKEVKSQAVEVMDRLDALKERLKLLPTSPGSRSRWPARPGVLPLGQGKS